MGFADAQGKVSVIPSSSFDLVCKVLAVAPEILAKALTHHAISVSPTEKYDTPLTMKQAEERREALSRTVYSMLFNQVVHRINESFSGGSLQKSKTLFIGVLDIFGFE